MLNLKKGLALVLAAATAFTFAPVANLGGSYVANAASRTPKNSKMTATLDLTSMSSGSESKSWVKVGEYMPDLASKDLAAGDQLVPFWYMQAADEESENNVYLTQSDSELTTGAEAPSFGAYTSTLKTIVTNVTQDSGSAQTPQYLYVVPRSGAKNGTYTWYIKLGTETWNGSSPEKGTDVSLASTPDLTVTVIVRGSSASATVGDVKVYSTPAPTTGTDTRPALAHEKDRFNNDKPYELYSSSKYYLTAEKTITSGSDAATAGTNIHITWTSSNPAIAEISKKSDETETATLTTHSIGSAKITASYIATTSVTLNGKTYTENDVIASTSFDVSVVDSATAIKVSYVPGVDGSAETFSKDETLKTIVMDTLINTTKKITTTGATTVVYSSDDTSVATVDQTGLVTAKAFGSAYIHVDTDKHSFQIPVSVGNTATDKITATVDGTKALTDDGYVLELDKAGTANGVTSKKITVKSLGNLPLDLVAVTSATANATYADPTIATVSQDGTVTAGTKDGIIFIQLRSTTKGNITGVTKYVQVHVNSLPQADTSAIKDVDLDLVSNKTVVLPAGFTYTAKTSGQDIVKYDATTRTITASKVGSTVFTASTLATSTTRATTKDFTVTVSKTAASKAASTFAVTSAKKVTLNVNSGAAIAVTGAAGTVTYTSDDPTVATVSGGAITALKAGTAVITVTDPGSDTVETKSETVVVTVTDSNVAPTPEKEVTAPEAVTGVTVKNKKGAFVKVTWDAQDSTVLYRVYKKVGNGSWKAKNVTSAGATLSVKKGASVKVKVKAFRKDANGKAVWQTSNATKYNNGKAFKTDKK